MTFPQQPADQRLYAIDALRGIAAAGVVILHSLKMFPLGLPYFAAIDALIMGVPLFFIISAFSMSMAYPSGLGDRAIVKRYALRRFFRIAPLLYLMLALWLAYYHWLGSPFPSLMVLASNITMTFGFTQAGIVPASWSIGIEVIFYALFPLLFLTKGIRSALALLVFSLIGAWAANSGEGPVPVFYYWIHPLTNAPYFVFGLLAWRTYLSVRHDRPVLAGRLLLGAGALLIAGMTAFGPMIEPGITPVPPVLIFGWGTGFCLILLSQALAPARLIDNSVTRFLGKVSYSLYLVHPFVIYTTGLPLHLAAVLDGPALAIAVPLATLALSIPIAMLLYHLIERPFMTLGRRLTA